MIGAPSDPLAISFWPGRASRFLTAVLPVPRAELDQPRLESAPCGDRRFQVLGFFLAHDILCWSDGRGAMSNGSSFQSEREAEAWPRDGVQELTDDRPSGVCSARHTPPPRVPFHRGRVMSKENVAGSGGRASVAQRHCARRTQTDYAGSAHRVTVCTVRFQREVSLERGRLVVDVLGACVGVDSLHPKRGNGASSRSSTGSRWCSVIYSTHPVNWYCRISSTALMWYIPLTLSRSP